MPRLFILALFTCLLPLSAHVGHHPSVHDTVANIIERMRRTQNPEALHKLTLPQAEALLTTTERHILGSEHLTFHLDQPATLYIAKPADEEQPFWLKDQQFERIELPWRESSKQLAVWKRDLPAGRAGLGINSLRGGGNHYIVAIQPKTAAPSITDLYPGQHRVTQLTNNVSAYADRTTKLIAIPDALAGSILIQTLHDRRDAGKILNLFRWTKHPSTKTPDQIILTWSGDPQTTQAIQWRTSTNTKSGYVLYHPKSELNPLSGRKPKAKKVRASTSRLEQKNLLNDPAIHHHTAQLTGLQPGTTYLYSVGSDRNNDWSEPAEFTTAPAGIQPFSFIYMGDAQNGLDRWGSLMQSAFRSRPDAAFYIMAGDLVDRGADRDDWDSLFHNARGIYDRRQLVPAIGNHECQGGHPTTYLNLFALPENGPAGIEKERAYSFNYGNALFVVLDSNLKPDTQSEWLDRTLAGSDATWKFVIYHHPAYSSAVNRDNKDIREIWGKIFDKYHVDLALQGHDHAYLRTYPMRDGQRAASPKEGTVYIVSVSGTKLYDQDKRDYTEFGMTNVATYQVLDIQISGDRLVYRAWDIDGKIRDELIIEKK